MLAGEGATGGETLCSLPSALEKSAWCLGKIKGSRITLPVLPLLLSVRLWLINLSESQFPHLKSNATNSHLLRRVDMSKRL